MIQILLTIVMVGIVVGFFFRQVTEHFISGPIPELPTPYLEDTEDDPRDIPWIASMTPADKEAREGQNCAVKYTEKGSDGITIITTSRSCEAGMPHTREGRIYLPDSITEAFRAEILAHERIHILQRADPDKWANFYRRNWSFILYNEPPKNIPTKILDAKRGNPDTFKEPWPCWMGRYWPVPIYNNMESPTLRDTSTVWWDDYKQAILTTPPASWTTFFGTPSQDEHPHEIAAVMIVAGDTATEAGRRLLNWWGPLQNSVLIE